MSDRLWCKLCHVTDDRHSSRFAPEPEEDRNRLRLANWVVREDLPEEQWQAEEAAREEQEPRGRTEMRPRGFKDFFDRR